MLINLGLGALAAHSDKKMNIASPQIWFSIIMGFGILGKIFVDKCLSVFNKLFTICEMF